MNSENVTVVVADEHPVFVEGIRFALDRTDGITVVGTAGDGLDALRLAVRLQPDVVFISIGMPGTDGLTAIRHLARRCPGVRVLALGGDDGDAGLLAAFKAGAHGYIAKDARPTEIASAIRAVALGHLVVGAHLSASVVARVIAPPERSPFPGLTQREFEVLGHLADGRSNAEIARAMHLSTKTVRNHVSNVLTKMQAANRVDVALRARDAGLGSHREEFAVA